MLVIKFHFRSEVRRIAIAEPLPFYQLIQLAKEIFVRLPSEFAFQYQDEEADIITVSSEKEIQEAFRVAQSLKPSILNLSIVPYSYQPQTQQTPSFPWSRCGGQRSCGYRFLNIPTNNDAPRFVHPAICDHCDERIVGYRFKCSSCDDFDLCESCYDEGKHDETHVFLKIHPSAYFRRPWFARSCGFSRGPCQTSFGACFKKEEETENQDDEIQTDECCKEEYCQCNKNEENDEEEYEEDFESEDEESENKETDSTQVESAPASSEVAPQAPVAPEVPAPSTPAVQQPVSSPQPDPIKPEKQEVVPEPVKPAQVPSPKPTSPFQRKLQELNDMGFENRDKNIELLLKFNGDLVKVVQALLESN